MSALSLEEIAEFLLHRAQEHGADAVDTIVAEGDSLEVSVRLGEIEKVKRATSRHLGLRVFSDKRSAVTSTADFAPASLAALARDSVELARATAPDPCAGLPAEDELAGSLPDLDLYDAEIEEVTPETAIEWCRAGEAAARSADERITNSDGAEFASGTSRVVYAASNGFSGQYRSSISSLSVVPIAVQDGCMERDYWYTVRRHLRELESPEKVGRRAAQRTLRRLGSRRAATCEVPVVFDPETAGSLLGHLAGAVSGTALYQGTSFLAGKLGETIAAPAVHIIDDGTRPRLLGSKPFDAEGVASRRTHVVEDGILRSYLFDTYSARKLESRTTGNAARSVADSPHASSSNFILQAGDTTPEEIISSVHRGLYVTELMGFGVNPVTGDYSQGAVGLWIENGKFAYPVSEITIAGNLLRMFQDIDAVGNDLELRHGIAAPTLRVGKMTVAGT